MGKKLALTYDDGPNTPYTLDLLNVLSKHNVRATFFMVGKCVKERPDIAKQVSDAGHLVGNHTFTHPKLTTLSMVEVEKEIRSCEDILTQVVGPHSRLFRPPYILTSPEIEACVVSCGLTTVMFNAAGSDWRMKGVDYITDKVHTELKGDSGIILLHDGSDVQMGVNRADTVAATDRMITRYKDEGFEFVFPLGL